MKLQILHKGLLLIFTPLLLQLVFVAQLSNLVNQVEELEHEAENRMSFIFAADQVVMELGDSWTIIVCNMFQSGAYRHFDDYRSHLEALNKRLKQIATTCPNLEKLLPAIEQVLQEQDNLYREMKLALGNDEFQPQALARIEKMRPKFTSVASKGLMLKTQMQSELKTLEENWKSSDQKRASLKKQIFIGLVADFAVTSLLLLVFLSDITKRLKVLVGNAALLPTGQALAQTVPGSDELAMLDVVLHNAATELSSAKEHRKSIMEMVAHDLRSPLSAAKSTVEVLLRPSASISPEQSRLHLSRVKRSLNQLISFVEDLLTIDRLESGKLELELSNFKIHALVDDCFETLHARASGQHIELVKEGDNFEVVADEARLSQVLMNLLTNAIKHSPDGGTVKVVTESGHGLVKVSVVDQGKGIPEADRDKVFQKFVQSINTNSQEGFGLGLAICKLIVDAHQGKIGLNSDQEKGTEFWFTLPDED